MTLYVFSTENWTRPKSETAGLMRLLGRYLDKLSSKPGNASRVIISGAKTGLPENILKKITNVVKKTKNNKGITLNLALNYGARQEIVDTFNKLMKSKKTKITQCDIQSALYNDLPDPDLIIRTSGERRLSNFLLWQAAYSELYFTKTLWPDFGARQLKEAIRDYRARKRKFGAI
jgi:undecaprenyl diphosphate synthase